MFFWKQYINIIQCVYTLYSHCVKMVNKGFSIYLDNYSKYVIEKLDNIKGKSQSDVAKKG